MKDVKISRIKFLGLVFIVLLSGSVACSKDFESSQPQVESNEASQSRMLADLESEESPAPGAGSPKLSNENRTTLKKEGKKDVEFNVAFPRFPVSDERLLEYHVNLVFETLNFRESRNLAYALAAEFGFLQSSIDNFEQPRSLTASLYVRSEKLYEFLQKVNELGKLQSENIRTEDLTYDRFSTSVTLSREAVRGRRRGNALAGSPNAQNYVQRERLLAESEDKEDEATRENWRIRDKVSWAKINISIHDPKIEPGVDVPPFHNIGYDMLNMLLALIYYALYIIPFFAVVLGIYLGVQKLYVRFFKKKS